jgi:hypothetical protein
MARRRRVEHSSASDSGCGAKDNAVTARSDDRFRQAKLGETVADPNDAREQVRGSMMHMHARRNLGQRLEFDVEAVARRIGAGRDECIAAP